MKRRILIFMVILSALLGACAQPSSVSSGTPESSSSEAVENTISSVDPASLPEAASDKLSVADAALYRGTVCSIESAAGGKAVVLEQAEGTNFGAKSLSFLLTPDSRLSFEDAQLAVGAYLEVYYGRALGQPLDEKAVHSVIVANLYPDAAMVNFNGTLRAIESTGDGGGRLTMEEMGTAQEVIFNYDSAHTQFYLNLGELKPGDTLNIFHRGAYAMSMPPQGSPLEVRRYTPAA
ncbi:MAG: hypothetical protein RRY21_04645 [Oscillospiraceae bacterium]